MTITDKQFARALRTSPARRLRYQVYRVVVAPKTVYFFWKYYRMAGEPRPAWLAVKWTWRTL